VEEVRNCKGAKGVPGWKSEPPSERRRSLAHAVTREREILPDYVAMEPTAVHEMIDGMNAGDCAEFIRLMLQQPYIEKTSFGDFPEIKPGKYALMDGDDVKFYQVSKVIREGAPRILYGLYGAPGEFRKHRIYRADNIMARIAADPNAAFALFGQRVGQCGVCSSPLTQQHTRERGVGDICWGKLNG
jgi:hypothetical protein